MSKSRSNKGRKGKEDVAVAEPEVSESAPSEAAAPSAEAPRSPAPAGPVFAGPDAWTRSVPTPIHWLLTIATAGLWAIVWRKPARKWLPALASGSLLFLSFAGFDVWPFGFIFVVPMLYLIEQCETTKSAWWWSWLTGTIANYGGFYWVGGLLTNFAHMHWSLAGLLCVLLAGFQGLSFAVFGTLVHVIRSRRSWPSVLVAPVVWVGVELLMPLIFPFYLGNSQYNFPPMIQIAEVLGPLGVSAVLFVSNGAIWDAMRSLVVRSGPPEAQPSRRMGWVSLGVGLAVVTANLVYGVVRMTQIDAEQVAAETIKIGMVEGDIGIFEKEDPNKIANNHVIHQRMSKQLVDEDKVDLIVWPESAFQVPIVFASRAHTDDVAELEASTTAYDRWIPHDVTWIPPSPVPPVADVREDLLAKASPQDRFAIQRGHNVPMLLGVITFKQLSPEEMASHPPNKKMWQVVNGKPERVTRDFRLYNSAILLDHLGRVDGVYDKNYLLVFGEYIPGADLIPWVFDLIPEASEFTPGTRVQTFPFGKHKIGVMICYEDIIPAFGRKLAAEHPNVIINITNDAWFGKTHEPQLHLALATFRAVETRKWLLRSTNTGISAFIDANGRIVAHTSLDDAEVISHEVPMMSGEETLYVKLGDVLGYLALLGIVLLLVLGRPSPPNPLSRMTGEGEALTPQPPLPSTGRGGAGPVSCCCISKNPVLPPLYPHRGEGAGG